jgi:hypothetical protein
LRLLFAHSVWSVGKCLIIIGTEGAAPLGKIPVNRITVLDDFNRKTSRT